jgi:two-component system phosphate regulon response regulator PhoB
MDRKVILVVEDDEDIFELVRYNLAKENYTVLGVTTAEEALSKVRMDKVDLIVLDLMLPGMDGLELSRFLKNDPKTENIPIIIATAKGGEADIVAGLELGSDDYIIKPFSPRVLIARIKAVFRRKGQNSATFSELPIRIRDLVIHPGKHEVTHDGKIVELTFTEFKILQLLSSHPGWVFTRYQIVESIRGDNYQVTDRSVDVVIVGLRKKLGTAGASIQAVRGVGYRFKE